MLPQRLAFAVAAHLDPDILLIDEVLSVGDLAFQRKCLEYAKRLQASHATVLFVSHNMFAVKALCRRVIYVAEGRVQFDGSPDDVIPRYERDSRLSTAPWAEHLIGADPAAVPLEHLEDARRVAVADACDRRRGHDGPHDRAPQVRGEPDLEQGRGRAVGLHAPIPRAQQFEGTTHRWSFVGDAIEQGHAVLLAWSPGASPAPPVNQFKSKRTASNTLWRMPIPITQN